MSASTVKLQYYRKAIAFAEFLGDFTIPIDERGQVDLHFAPAAQEYTLIPAFTR